MNKFVDSFLVFLNIWLGVKFWGHMITLVNFLRMCQNYHFTFYILDSIFSTSLSTLLMSVFFIILHPSGYKVVTFCDFDLNFLSD